MLPPSFLAACATGLMAETTAATAFLRRAEALAQPQNAGILDQLLANYKAPQMSKVGQVGIVPIKGMMGYNLGNFEKAIGMVDVLDIEANLDAALADPEVKAVMLDVDSPGGYTTGIEELSGRIANLPKPVETWGHFIHSAAVWSAGVANRVWGINSGLYGSIGAVMVVADTSGVAEQEGVKVHVISSGWAKGMLTPGAPVTDEQLAFLQGRVKANGELFKANLKAVRKTIPDEAMQGQFFSGREAASLGILTGIANRDQVIARLNSL